MADTANGLHKQIIINKIKAELSYRPEQLMIANTRARKRLNDSSFLRDRMFFVLSFSANNKELLKQLDFNRYSEMIQVFSFRMREFINVSRDEEKSIAPISRVFQPNFGMGSANNILIVFKKNEILSAKKLRFKVTEFGLSTGDLIFDFDIKNIKNIPKIISNY